MTNTNPAADPLAEIPVDRRFIDKLYAHQQISQEARIYLLNLLYPHEQWSLWISRLLLLLSTSLIASGIIYFCAFNWWDLPSLVKLAALEIGISLCILGAYFSSLQKLPGQILLLLGSTLVGVFMAVFGQIYQLGVNNYQIFLMWSVLISGWTLLSNFSAQWLLWLLLTNIFMSLYGIFLNSQSERDFITFIYIAIFNGTFLVLREYLALKPAYNWLAGRWLRITLTVATILPLATPIIFWLIGPLEWLIGSRYPASTDINPSLGIIGHGLIYVYTRYKLRDIRSVAVVICSSCLILDLKFLNLFYYEIFFATPQYIWLFMSLTTITIGALAVIFLKHIAKKIEINHG